MLGIEDIPSADENSQGGISYDKCVAAHVTVSMFVMLQE